MWRISRFVFAVIAVLTLAAVSPVAAQGTAITATIAAVQPPTEAQRKGYANPLVRLNVAALRRFDSALSALAAQGRVALVCEGQPLRLELSEAEIKELARKIGPSEDLPLEDAIREVAAAFDYDAVRSGATVFLLRKRYSDPDDLPDLTFEEIAASLQSILRATRNFTPAPSRKDIAKALLNSVAASEEQTKRLATGIPVSRLPPDQRQLAWQFACSFSMEPLDGITKVSRRL